jgi:hypothetical protein
LEICQGETTAGCFVANWLESQTTDSSHKILERPDWPDTVFAFHDNEEIGPRMLARVAKVTGLKPEDL